MSVIRARSNDDHQNMANPSASEEEHKVRLGANTATPPDILVKLASDKSMMVRAAVAINQAAPAEAHDLLANDMEERVRILLARKLAALAPSLSDNDQDQLHRRTFATLAQLVEDEAVRVRTAIADVMADMPHAPRALILRLAHDTAIPVSEPVIRLSPLLEPNDLIALLAAPPNANTATAVARRPSLTAAVSDAVAATADSAAIRELLANPTAAIQEATLDALVSQAVEHTDWHEPLVRRPILPAPAACALSEIVATHLLRTLADRLDFPPDTAEDLRRRLMSRLEQDGSSDRRRATATDTDFATQAKSLIVTDQPSEQKLAQAIREGKNQLAATILAGAAGVPQTAVDRAVSLRSSKALISLVWKAGYSTAIAESVQSALAGLAPASVLRPTPSGLFPLSAEEMRWQIDFLLQFVKSEAPP